MKNVLVRKMYTRIHNIQFANINVCRIIVVWPNPSVEEDNINPETTWSRKSCEPHNWPTDPVLKCIFFRKQFIRK